MEIIEARETAERLRQHQLLQAWLNQESHPKKISQEEIAALLKDLSRDAHGIHPASLANMLKLVQENPRAKELGLGIEDILQGRILNIGLEEVSYKDITPIYPGSNLMSENMVTILRRYLRNALGLDPQLTGDMENGYINGVVEQMCDLPDGSFDTIVSVSLFDVSYMNLIHILKNEVHSFAEAFAVPVDFYRAAAKEISRVLKNNGIFLLDTMLNPNDHFLKECRNVGMEIIPLVDGPYLHGKALIINHKTDAQAQQNPLRTGQRILTVPA